MRDLAKRLGITHQNTKEALIESVYKEVYLSRWKTEWETILRDPAKPLETRLVEFYESYLQAIFRYPETQVDHFHATCAGCSPRTRLQLGQGDRDLEVDRLEIVAIEATAGFEAVVALRP